MRVLLDTHALIWLVSKAAKLSPAARTLLRDSEIEPVVSIVSIWEMGIKSNPES